MNIDLHCHSTNSDGTWSVEQILKEAEILKVQALSITDHDNLKGSLEAFAIKDGIYSGILVPGIEISTRIEGHKVHLLAFFPTVELPPQSTLLESLEKIQNSRIWRMKEMIKKANAHGFEVTFDEVVAEASKGLDGEKQPTDVLSRPHLARVIINKGYATSMEEVFENYLADGKPFHVERFTLKYHEWIDVVHELNGLVIWAHPLHGHENDKASLERITTLLEQTALDGVERIYNYKGKYKVDETFVEWGEKFLDERIVQNNWLITAGGDFHGDVGVLGQLDLPEEHWKRFEARLFT